MKQVLIEIQTILKKNKDTSVELHSLECPDEEKPLELLAKVNKPVPKWLSDHIKRRLKSSFKKDFIVQYEILN